MRMEQTSPVIEVDWSLNSINQDHSFNSYVELRWSWLELDDHYFHRNRFDSESSSIRLSKQLLFILLSTIQASTNILTTIILGYCDEQDDEKVYATCPVYI